LLEWCATRRESDAIPGGQTKDGENPQPKAGLSESEHAMQMS